MRYRLSRHILPVLAVVLLALVWPGAAHAQADQVAIELLGVRGQTSPFSTPVQTVGGRMAIDEQGMLYGGTPGPGSYLQKLTPEGRVVWQHFHNVPGFQAVVIDEQYVYTAGAGYYGYRQVQRFRRDSGQPAEGWQHQWKEHEASNGVREMLMPSALAVDELYLYVIDSAADELRRLDKQTGAEAPFGKRVMVVEPRDLARTADGRLLVLTARSVLELDAAGKPLRVPLVTGLDNAAAIAFDPTSAGFYVAVGGSKEQLVNQVVQYDRDGKPTGWTLGRGGNFSGPWSADAFAFSEGLAGLTVEPGSGKLWVNPGYGHRLSITLSLLSCFGREGQYDHSILCVNGFGDLALDAAGAVYLEGRVKFDAQGDLAWTSGLIHSGSAAGYPATHVNWPTLPLLVGQRMFNYVQPDGTLYELDPTTGKLVAPLPPKRYTVPGKAVLASDGARLLLALADSRQVQQVALTLDAPPVPVLTLAGAGGGAITAMTADREHDTLYVREGKQVSAYALSNGAERWHVSASGGVAAAGGLVIVGSDAGKRPQGLTILDSATGTELAELGVKDFAGLPAFPATANLAAVSQGERVLLAVKTPGMIRLYALRRLRAASRIPLETPQETPPTQAGAAAADARAKGADHGA